MILEFFPTLFISSTPTGRPCAQSVLILIQIFYRGYKNLSSQFLGFFYRKFDFWNSFFKSTFLFTVVLFKVKKNLLSSLNINTLNRFNESLSKSVILSNILHKIKFNFILVLKCTFHSCSLPLSFGQPCPKIRTGCTLPR